MRNNGLSLTITVGRRSHYEKIFGDDEPHPLPPLGKKKILVNLVKESTVNKYQVLSLSRRSGTLLLY